MRFLWVTLFMLILSASVFGQSSRSSSDTFVCSADARWTNSGGTVNYSRSSQLSVALSLLTHVSSGSSCLNADLLVTVTFLDDSQNFICSGSVANSSPALAVTSHVQTFNIEIRPFNQIDFLRWRNPPGVRGMQQGKRLSCANIDGTAEVGDTERVKAAWVRVTIAVLPPGGGLAIIEEMIRVAP
jgi:hypothetical protein